MFKNFFLSVQFLSRFPTPQYTSITAMEMGRSVSWFPVVGALIGAVLVAVAQLQVWLPPEVVAGVVLAVWILSTGALHLDGLADTADGWLAGGDHQHVLEVMKDSRIGTGGGVALVGLLLLKWSLVVVLIEYQAWWFLLVVPIVGRISSIGLMTVTRYVSVNGVAEQMFLHLRKPLIWLWVSALIVGLLWVSPGLFIGLLLAWFWMRWVMIRMTGGMTGDTAGAMTEVMELAFMLGSAVILIN